jgi:spermidine/putrescine transport system permease protein
MGREVDGVDELIATPVSERVEAPASRSGALRRRRTRRLGPVALTAPATLGLLLFFAAPFVTFAVYSVLTGTVYSFRVGGPVTAENYVDVFTTAANWPLFRNALVIGAATGTVTLAVAIPVAYWMRYCAGAWQLPVLFAVTGTIFASYLVRIYAWRTMLGENGIVNQALTRLGLIDAPIGFLLYSRVAVVIALVHILLPFAVLMLFAAFRPLEPRFLEAAEDLGASRLERWRRVVLPCIAAPALTAFMLSFVLAASDYVTPQFLGGARGSLIGVQIQSSFKALGDYAQGAALSMVVLLSFVLLYALLRLALRLLRVDAIRWSP